MAGVSKSYYARVLGTFWRHPRTVPLSLAARGLWVTLLSYSADHRTDGRVDKAVLPLVLAGQDGKRALTELVEAEMLTEEEPGAYQIRDWDQHNITKERHERALEANRGYVARSRGKGVSKEPRKGERKVSSKAPGKTLRKPLPSDQDQDQDQEQDPLSRISASPSEPEGRPEPEPAEAGEDPETEPGPDRREPPSVREPWPTDADPTPDERDRARKLSRCREAIGADLEAGYRAIAESDPDFTVPTWNLSGMAKPIERLAEAFVGRRSAWDRTCAAFFASPRAKAGGFSVHHLAANPNQYLAESDSPKASAAPWRGAAAKPDVSKRPALEGGEAIAYDRAKGRIDGSWQIPPQPWEPACLERAIAKGWDPVADAAFERAS